MTIQKYCWIINIVGISIISYLLADISSQIIFERIRDHAPTLLKDKYVPKESPMIKHNLNYYNIIFDKNVFRKEIDIAGARVSVDDRIEADLHISPPVPSQLDLRLVGTTLKGGMGFMAFLEDKKSKEQTEYRIGDMIGSDTRLVNIERESVIVERNGKMEVIEFPPFEELRKGGGSRLAARKKSYEGVTNVSDKTWVLDRRYVDNEIKNMGRLMTQVRAVPAGKKGFKVFNIKRGSMFEKIGLKNGDLIKKINGVDISSPDKAIEMYQQLQGASDIQIDIIRNGVSRTFNYSIR